MNLPSGLLRWAGQAVLLHIFARGHLLGALKWEPSWGGPRWPHSRGWQ